MIDLSTVITDLSTVITDKLEQAAYDQFEHSVN